MKVHKLILIGLTLLLMSQLIGCMAAAVAYEAVAVGRLAKGVIGGIDGAKVDAAVSPGVTKEQLNRIKRVTFAFEEEDPVKVAFSNNLSAVMSDTLIMEMLKLGFECIGTQKIKKALEAQGTTGIQKVNLENTLKAAPDLGIQAIISVNVKMSSSFGTGGVFSTKVTSTSKIQSASLKIIDATDANILMVVSINYKHGKNPAKASKAMAKIIKVKLENPFGKKKKKK